MRSNELYLSDIVEAASSIASFLEGIDEDAFHESDMVRSSVLHKLTVIGEAGARLPADFRDRFPDVPWADIIGLRNYAVHAYFAIDWDIVWATATLDVPALGLRVAEILASIRKPDTRSP